MPSTVETSVNGASSRVKFSDFIFREVGHSQGNLVDLPYNPNMTLIKLFWTDSSFAAHETIFRAADRAADDQDDIENSNALKLKKRVVHPKKEVAEDDFIVDDWDESVAPSRTRSRQIPFKPPAADLQWTLNWASIYSLAVANLTADASQATPEDQGLTFDQIIERLRTSTTEQPVDGRISETRLVDLRNSLDSTRTKAFQPRVKRWPPHARRY